MAGPENITVSNEDLVNLLNKLTKLIQDAGEINYFIENYDTYLANSESLKQYYEVYNQTSLLMKDFKELVVKDYNLLENIRKKYIAKDEEISKAIADCMSRGSMPGFSGGGGANYGK
ncbi:MAG: hypothetical protein J6X97_04380 [Lachnospiraceae bacterium]|nr:hypothetical protein [Lachnospiraceae bacterium]